jgi:Ca2+/Na+ antiporter
MLASALVLLYFMVSGRTIGRWAGAGLILAYVAYIGSVFGS